MKAQQPDAIRRWLDEAATAMEGSSRARRDALMELETSIHERLDERAGEGPVTAELVRDVLEMLGDPVEVGASMMPGRPLIEPYQTRRFLLNTGVLFAVHFMIVVGATLAGRELAFPPLRIQPIADPKNFLALFGAVFGTAIFDAGLVLCGYLAVRRVGRFIRVPSAALSVAFDPRRNLQSAFFLLLVLVVVNFFRNDLLALYVASGEGTSQVPFVGPGIVDNLLLLNLWLGGAVARELGYAALGERRLTLGLDLLVGVTGLFCLLRMVATRNMVDLEPARAMLGPAADGIGALLDSVFVLLALAAAAMLAARTIRRLFRIALIGR